MSPQQDNPQGRPRALIASYGVLMAGAVFAIAIVILMNRFHSLLEDSMDLVELQYEESLEYASIVRHIQIYAQESAEAIARGVEIPERDEHLRAARRILAPLTAKSDAIIRAEGAEEAREDAAEASAVADALEAFVRQVDELGKLDRTVPGFAEKLRTTFEEFLRQKLIRIIDAALAGERADVQRNVEEYRAGATRWTWGVSLLLLVLIGIIVTPLYLRLDRGIRRLADGARQVAAGDYSTRVASRGIFRPIGEAFNSLAQRVQESQLAQLKMAKELQASSAELLAVAKQTETNAADEAAAVEETRRTMVGLLASATEIAESADKVASSAEHSARASEKIGEQILKLSAQSAKIRKITAVIQGVADKSDVLALNASLEGAKAGESGRGFVLLGSEMRRLAESVGSAAYEVGELALEIEELSKRAVLSTEMGQKFAGATLEVANRINLITSQQRGATEQVTKSMEDVHQYTQHSLSAAKQTRSTASGLVKTSDELEQLVKASAGVPAERA